MSKKKIGMDSQSDSVKRLINLLIDEFQLPETAVSATISIGIDYPVSIQVEYYPVERVLSGDSEGADDCDGCKI